MKKYSLKSLIIFITLGLLMFLLELLTEDIKLVSLILMFSLPATLAFFYNKTLMGKKLWEKIVWNLIWIYSSTVVSLCSFTLPYKFTLKQLGKILIWPFLSPEIIPIFCIIPVMAILGGIFYSTKVKDKEKSSFLKSREKEVLFNTILGSLLFIAASAYSFILLIILALKSFGR